MSEPFSAAYYDGPEALSQRFDCSDHEATLSSVRQLVLDRAAAEPVFVKDMACHVLPALDDTLINACTHTLLVRDPAWSLPSMARFHRRRSRFRTAGGGGGPTGRVGG